VRIDGQIRSSNVGARGAATKSTGVAFQPSGLGETARASSATPMAATTAFDAILALQQVDDPLARKRKAVRRGLSLLDILDGIKADVLTGQVSEARLDQLMGLIAMAREESLPGLDAVLDDIELRARVELAKFGRFTS
jgi:hypothetical protein